MTNAKLTGLAIALSILLAGCGGDGASNEQAESAAQSGATDDRVDENDYAALGSGEESYREVEGDQDDEDGGDVVKLDASAATEAGIVVMTAELGDLDETVSLPAELRFDADRVARVAASVSGLVSRLDKGEGDNVQRGERLALLSSRELAELKADFLTAKSAEDLATSRFVREERLFADKITSESELDAARSALVSARVAREAVENKLHAVGVDDGVLHALTDAPDGALANAAITAPIAGTVVSRSVSVGSSVEAGGNALFVIVDDAQLWADIAIYKADADKVISGQRVVLRARDGQVAARGEIDLILPVIDETTRTGTARVIIDNPGGELRPGQFVTAEITTGEGMSVLHVPSDAIVEVEGRASLFVPAEGGFAPRPVETGSSGDGLTEILQGLSAGDRFVSDGAFTLKAQLEKDAFGDGHGH